MNRHDRRRVEATLGTNKPGMHTVIFRRADGWYPLELPVTDDLARHAEWNPGTLAVEALDGTVLWSLQ